MNIDHQFIREVLESRAREYYDDNITTITTEWMDGRAQITVYHLFVEQRPLRTWFHCWQYLDEDTIVERFTYVDGDRTFTNVDLQTGGFTDITDDVMVTVEAFYEAETLADEMDEQDEQSAKSMGIGN